MAGAAAFTASFSSFTISSSPRSPAYPLHPSCSLFNTHNYKFPSLSTFSNRRNKFVLPKANETEVSSPEAEDTEIVPAELESEAVVRPPRPKTEEIFAVVMVGGRQYIVFPGRYLTTQRLKGANINDKIVLNKVLLVGTKTKTWIGQPVVPNATVHAVVEEQGLNDKVIVFKYKKKKNYRRNIGHRQPNTRIKITGITGYENSPFVTLDS